MSDERSIDQQLADMARDAGPAEPDPHPLDLRSMHWREARRFSGRVFVRDEPAVLARLDALARRRGTTRSTLIREAVRAFLDRLEDETP